MELANKIITAVMTNENSPKVIKLIGKLSKFKTGLTKALRSPMTIATPIAAPYPSIDTPGNNLAKIKIINAETNKLMIKLIG